MVACLHSQTPLVIAFCYVLYRSGLPFSVHAPPLLVEGFEVLAPGTQSPLSSSFQGVLPHLPKYRTAMVEEKNPRFQHLYKPHP